MDQEKVEKYLEAREMMMAIPTDNPDSFGLACLCFNCSQVLGQKEWDEVVRRLKQQGEL